MSDVRKLALLFSGSLLVAIGASLVGTFAVESSLLPVFIGYMFFVLGYKISWLVSHDVETFGGLAAESFEIMKGESRLRILRNFFLIVTGVIITSYGTILFASYVLESNGNVVLAGAMTFGGYMLAHEGVNEVLV